jgi:Ser/Thr protein kinase RdoA (MazF antagonist)
LGADGLPWLHSHGDVCPRNFFHVEGNAILFDFQAAHFGPRIEDLAEGALEFAFTGTELDEKLINSFIEAYRAINPLSADENKLLPTMLFLQSAFKLARAFRVEVLFGYKVDKRRVSAFLNFATNAIAKN